jgi:hypothetical protein
VGGVFEVFGGMAIGRAVATADMTTAEAETQMNPGGSDFQAFFAALSMSSHRLDSSHMWTGHESPPWLKGEAKLGVHVVYTGRTRG